MLLTIALLAACGGPSDCDPTGMTAGGIEASIDGDDWTGSGAQWSWAGDGVQITTADSDGWRFTIAASTAADGRSLTEALGDGVDVDVAMGGGNFIAIYPSGESISYAAREEGDGALTLHRLGTQLGLCFDAQASASSGDAVDISGGLAAADCAGECE